MGSTDRAGPELCAIQTPERRRISAGRHQDEDRFTGGCRRGDRMSDPGGQEGRPGRFLGPVDDLDGGPRTARRLTDLGTHMHRFEGRNRRDHREIAVRARTATFEDLTDIERRCRWRFHDPPSVLDYDPPALRCDRPKRYLPCSDEGRFRVVTCHRPSVRDFLGGHGRRGHDNRTLDGPFEESSERASFEGCRNDDRARSGCAQCIEYRLGVRSCAHDVDDLTCSATPLRCM